MINPGRQIYTGASRLLLAYKGCILSSSECQLLVVKIGREEAQSQGLTGIARTGLEDWISSKLCTTEKKH
jgi:hypothetical protein